MNFANALRQLEPTAEITALGTIRGLDTTLIPARGYQLELIPPVPPPRTLNRALLQTPGSVRDSVRAASAVLDRVRAEIVVGFGGYAAPAYLTARRRGLPIVVHEANARPGVANRLAARMTTYVFTATPSVRLAHATAIGIPLRPAITGLDRPALRHAARQRFGPRPDGPVLMVTGGSQGARAIAAMSARASAAGAPDADVVLARHVLTAVAGRRRLAS
jgi:UDP-N-acetylglucosamine--N-acetylmuramyl-(pentapeptide) pyrophosphoryl-undecaprenol N-acetylglucosamine transferase